MLLDQEQAGQVAALLNARNQLTLQYSAKKVLASRGEYIIRQSDDGNVIACVEVELVQWYQAEIRHLTVAETVLRKGHAKKLLASARELASSKGARLLQCTIREGNTESEGLFRSLGFACVGAFHYDKSGNNVNVYQMILAPAHH